MNVMSSAGAVNASKSTPGSVAPWFMMENVSVPCTVSATMSSNQIISLVDLYLINTRTFAAPAASVVEYCTTTSNGVPARISSEVGNELTIATSSTGTQPTVGPRVGAIVRGASVGDSVDARAGGVVGVDVGFAVGTAVGSDVGQVVDPNSTPE